MVEISSSWYRLSVKAIIRNKEGKVLLCKESDGKRDIPGGGLDRGEDELICLKRELQEETGLIVSFINPKPSAFITVNKPSSEKRPWLANVCYEVEVENLNFVPSDECIEIGFFDLEGIKSLNTFVNVVPVFSKLFFAQA